MCIGLSDVEVEKQWAEHTSLRNTCTQSRGITLRKLIPNHILVCVYIQYVYICYKSLVETMLCSGTE